MQFRFLAVEQSTVEQSSFEPGTDLTFQAVLTEYDIPVEKRAQVQVELTRLNGSLVTLPMSETEPGTFELTFAIYAGIYHARIIARGVTLRGALFTRELLADADVWKGGDHPYQPPRDTGKDDWCQLLNCLLSDKNLSRKFSERLKKEGINLDDIQQCIKPYCHSTDRKRDPR